MANIEVFKDHRIAELWGLKDLKVLHNKDLLFDKAHSLAERLKLTVIGEFIFPFEPRDGEEEGGVTILLGISESHLAIHTWFRERYMHIDAFSCSPDTNMNRFRQEVISEFASEKTKIKKIRY